jgi:hypothetical protein
MKLILQAVSKRNIVEAEWEVDLEDTIKPKTLPVPIFRTKLPRRAFEISIWIKPEKPEEAENSW